MKTKLTFLLSLTFLFLFSGSVFGDDFQDGVDAYQKQDYKTAYKLLLPFAEQGNALAQKNLGYMYSEGKGVLQDLKEGLKWTRLATEQGHAGGQYNLGWMYDNGQGVPQDYKEAVRLYRLSAEQGEERSQYYLGKMYANGQGVPQDYVSAHMWWNICASSGERVCVENRDTVENGMTPQQIEKAKEMARNWKPKK